MYFAQDSLIFKPTHRSKAGAEIFPGASEYWINTSEGNRLQTWYKPVFQVKRSGLSAWQCGNLSTRGRLINISLKMIAVF